MRLLYQMLFFVQATSHLHNQLLTCVSFYIQLHYAIDYENLGFYIRTAQFLICETNGGVEENALMYLKFLHEQQSLRIVFRTVSLVLPFSVYSGVVFQLRTLVVNNKKLSTRTHKAVQLIDSRTFPSRVTDATPHEDAFSRMITLIIGTSLQSSLSRRYPIARHRNN